MLRRVVLAVLNLAAIAFAIDRVLGRLRGDTVPTPLRIEVVVDAPIEETWAIVADIPLQPVWMVEMRNVRITTTGPTGVGTRGEATVRIAGISVTDPVEVVEFQPPHRFAIRHEGLFTGGGLITLEASADGASTTVRWEETLIPPVLPELGALVQAPILRSIFQGDLARLKRLVETGDPEA
jgi:uncharacterized protein YndB with AHSA1/START domain